MGRVSEDVPQPDPVRRPPPDNELFQRRELERVEDRLDFRTRLERLTPRQRVIAFLSKEGFSPEEIAGGLMPEDLACGRATVYRELKEIGARLKS